MENNRFLQTVLDDIEDAVEHFPSGLFSKQPVRQRWEASRWFLNLRVDALLLDQDLPDEILADIHDALANQTQLTEEAAITQAKRLIQDAQQ